MTKTIGLLLAVLLVPALVSAQALAIQGAAAVFVMGPDGVTKNMELKATKDASGPKQVQGFALAAENVVSSPLNGKLTVFGDVAITFSGAKLTPAGTTDTLDIPITEGEINLAGVAQGVYTLDVIVSDTFAYEALLVIGPVEQQIINKEITEINTNTDVKIFEKGKNKVKQELNVCSFHPNDDPSCKPDAEGNCPSYAPVMNEQGNCHGGKCPKGYEKLDDDETGTCYSKKNTIHCPISNAIVLDKDHCAIYEPDETPTPTPTPEPTEKPSEELSSNCGGQPCSDTEKEDSWLSEKPESSPGVPIEPEPEPEDKEQGQEQNSQTTEDKDSDDEQEQQQEEQ